MPTFGRGTICRFHTNASAMKKLAACDFEDLLQCVIPVFEGLLPNEHNGIVLNMLFDLAAWHGYAKLCMHTDDTLDFFDTATIALGNHYYTTELPHEHAPQVPTKGKERAGPKFKSLNLSTYKFHTLGDYANMIRRAGTTDNYSTQSGELEHKQAKCWYPRMPKNQTMIATMTHLEA
ncbi:hypothetical protein BDR04DRAFT_1130454 [Suillus decipiens]|nr:hypothetical protein BDR04DRAFT_1130454 [Suillus decipiens]